jgi:hypothetical protein
VRAFFGFPEIEEKEEETGEIGIGEPEVGDPEADTTGDETRVLEPSIPTRTRPKCCGAPARSLSRVEPPILLTRGEHRPSPWPAGPRLCVKEHR